MDDNPGDTGDGGNTRPSFACAVCHPMSPSCRSMGHDIPHRGFRAPFFVA